jgi:amidase
MSEKIGRREFLGTAAAAGAAVAVGTKSFVTSANAAAKGNLTSASASALAEAIHSKKVSSKTVVDAYLARIAEVNPKFNAVVQLTAESARKQADDWLAVTSKARFTACRSRSRTRWRRRA